MKLNKRTIDAMAEAEYARVEQMQMTAADRAALNEEIDAQREQEAAADEEYWQRQAEIEDERRNDA